MEGENTSSSEASTRERILLAAGELFGEQGFEAVSLRQLTQAAEVNLAAVSYHFGSKDGLIEELISGCVGPILERRLELLTAAEDATTGEPVSLDQILRSFIQPVIERAMAEGEQGEIFLRLMGRCTGETGYRLPKSCMPGLSEMAARYGAAAGRTLPDLPEDVIIWRLHFTFGVLAQTLLHRHELEGLSGGRSGTPDDMELVDRIVDFCRAGFRAPHDRRSKTARMKKSLQQAAAPVLAIGIGILTLGLTACQVAPPALALDGAELPTPESWAAGKAASAGVDSRWIDRFGDKALVRVVEEALSNSPDLQGAAARLDVARENAALAGVAARPTVNAGLGGRRQKQNFIGFPFGGDGPVDGVSSNLSNNFGVSLDASWELDLWGRMRAGVSAATGEYQASEADLRAVQASLAAQVAKAWFALSEARMQLDLAKETEASYGETEEVIRDRFEAGRDDGRSNGAQLRLAMSDVSSARASVAGQKEAVARTTRQLEALLGRYPKGVLSGSATLPKPPSLPPVGLPSELLTRRPDILAAERRYALQAERIREARLAAFPSLSLTGSTGTATEELSDILNSDFGVWSLAGNLLQPLLTGGQLKAESSKRKAEQRGALANLQSIVLRAFSEVETALAVDSLMAERESALSDAVRLAGEATTEARADYTTGVGDVLTVLAAQARHLQAKAQHISARRVRLDNRIDLHLALGGDYKPNSK